MRTRSLSEEGRTLFNLSYASVPTKKGIRKLLSCIRCHDDDVVDTLVQQCRDSSEHLMGNLTHKNLARWVDNFIYNVIILILKDKDDVARYHVAKKNFGLYLCVAKRALKTKDHNTAWLMLCAFANKAIVDLGFRRGQDYIDRCTRLYGTTSNSFQNHALEVAEVMREEVEKRDYIPVAAILNMYSKRMQQYQKACKSMQSSFKQHRLQHIETMVNNYEEQYKTISQDKQLLPLYKELATLPGLPHLDAIAFGDLLEVSKVVRNTKKGSKPEAVPALKRIDWIYNPMYPKPNPTKVEQRH